jgi:type II secretory pathway component PulF
MATYNYRALDSSGRERKGELEAANKKGAITLIRKMSLFPTKLKWIQGEEINSPNMSTTCGDSKTSESAGTTLEKALLFPEDSFCCKHK